jgi:GntR family transcriptional regulator, transcriptional repressor for pyruvate dehydrogenase complex
LTQVGVHFERIEQQRAHEYVAEQLRRHIGLGLVVAGEPFPPERELAQMFGVGRATIQHALRLLEADRLIESRRGRTGGTFVIGPERDEQGLERLLDELRETRGEIESAMVFRRIVEEATARLAADHAEPADIEAMEAANRGMNEAETELELHRYDTEFHLQVARAGHNELLYQAVERARLLLNSALLAQPESEIWHERIDNEHLAVIAAVKERDATRARQEMATHLEHSEQGIRALLAALR